MPKVSIIIPTYNRAEYISETIDSILNQTCKDFEVIVVDDGSTDNTKEVLEKYGNKIKVIWQENSERAIARNKGVKNSSGEYIAFIDSDDIWEKDKLEKQVQILDQHKQFIVSYGQCLRINEKSKKIKSARRQKVGFSGNIFEKMLFRNLIVSPTPVVRRKYFEMTSGFETKYIPYEDWELWSRVSVLGEFHYTEEPLAYYRIHEQQSVQLVKAEKIEEVTTLLLENSYSLKEIPEDLKNKSRAYSNLKYAFWYLISNKNKTAKEKLAKAKNLYPSYALSLEWVSLNLMSDFPILKKIINPEKVHLVF